MLTPGDFSRRQSRARSGIKDIKKLLNLSQEDDSLQARQGIECIYPTNSHACNNFVFVVLYARQSIQASVCYWVLNRVMVYFNMLLSKMVVGGHNIRK